MSIVFLEEKNVYWFFRMTFFFQKLKKKLKLSPQKRDD
jgi:hypothetical protein